MRLTDGYAGWRIVFACFLMALFGWGLSFYAHGIFLVQIQKTTGWSTTFISSVITSHYLLSALLLIGTSDAMERFGPRTLIMVATVLQAVAVVSLPFVTQAWQLVVIYLLFAIAWSGMSSVPIATLIGRWFERRRGLALNLALSGATAAGIVIAPAMLYLSANHGFALATQSISLVMLVVLGLAVPLLVRWPREAERAMERVPNSAGSATQAAAVTAARTASGQPAAPAAPTAFAAPLALTRRQTLRRLDFWTIAGAFALALLVQVGFITQQVAILTPSMNNAQIGVAIALTTGTALVGRIAMGFFIDRLDQRRGSAVAFISQALALAIIQWATDPLLLQLACVVYGFSVGNVITLAALIIQKEFPSRSYGTVVGLSTAIGQVTYSFGPAVFGLLRDSFGGYRAPLTFGILLYLAAAVIVTRGRSQPGAN